MVKFPSYGRSHPLPPPYLPRGEFRGDLRSIEAVRSSCRYCRAGNLACLECVVKLPGNVHPHPLPPPMGMNFGVIGGPSEAVRSGCRLGSMPKLNFSVIVTPACVAVMVAERNVSGDVVPHTAGLTAGLRLRGDGLL